MYSNWITCLIKAPQKYAVKSQIVPQTNYRQTTQEVVEVAPKLIINRCKGEKKRTVTKWHCKHGKR